MRHEGCQCPCIPKCCPQGYILKKNWDNRGLHHGYDCQKLPNAPLPIVQIKDDLTEPVNQTFFAGVFPSCEGLGPNWTYTHHLTFELEPIYDDYILHLGENETVMTQFGNDHDQAYMTQNDVKDDSTIVKHLMFFCFDQMEDAMLHGVETVALTCPKKKLSKLPLSKCCPQGKVLQVENNTCIDDPNNSSLSIPINGHMYKGDELEIDANKVNI